MPLNTKYSVVELGYLNAVDLNIILAIDRPIFLNDIAELIVS